MKPHGTRSLGASFALLGSGVVMIEGAGSSANASWTNRAANDVGFRPRRAPARPRPILTPGTKRALELVAMRGRDVIGVRHLLEGARATIGRGPDAFARISIGEAGDDVTIAEVERDEQFVLWVPPRARVRTHLASGLGRLGTGPERLVLTEGDRSVLVLPGGIHVRAQIVPIETFGRSLGATRHPARWLAVAASLYLAALVLCATLAPSKVPPMVTAALQRVALSAQAAAIAAQ